MKLTFSNTQFCFMRHAPAVHYATDALRELTVEGGSLVQAIANDLGIKFDFAATSPAIRTLMTTRLMLGKHLTTTGFTVIDSMYSLQGEDIETRMRIEGMFRELGDARLDAYLSHRHADAFMILVTQAVNALGHEMWMEIGTEGPESIVEDKKILVVGHNPILSGMIHHLFVEAPGIRDYVLTTKLEPAEIFQIDVGDSMPNSSIRTLCHMHALN